MFNFLLSQLTEEKRLRVKYINAVYWLCVFFGGFFVLQYHFLYKYFDYDWLLKPLYLAILLSPLVGRVIKKYEITALFLFIAAALLASSLIYLAGAIQAPGVFWVTLFPISGGILLGRRGAMLGAILIAIVTFFYIFAQYNWVVPNIVLKMDNYERQRIINFIGFSIFSIWIVFYFLSHESQAQEEIRRHKSEMESLLHILIHDVASPLVVMEMDIKKLKRKELTSEVGTSIERINRNLKNVTSLLKNIREMKAVRDGKIGFEKKPVNFQNVLNHTLEAAKHRIEEKQIEIVKEIELENCFILGDETFLQNIVLNNLIVNAIKFSPIGEKLVFRGRSDENYIYFEIQDYGVGMPEAILKNIFSLTYRTSRIGTGGEKGTGYGMLLVKEYVEKMNGTIQISSVEVGSGTGPSGTLIKLVFSKFDNNSQQITINGDGKN